jgi:hypothetical protein
MNKASLVFWLRIRVPGLKEKSIVLLRKRDKGLAFISHTKELLSGLSWKQLNLKKP